MSVAVAKTRVLGDEPLGRASTSTSTSTGTGTSSGGSSSSVKHQGNGATTTTTTFSFKIPTTPASASTTTTSASSSSTSPPASTPLKQRRVSLALPETPRVAEGWNFRDDTGLDAGAGAGTSRLRKAGKAAATAGSGTVASSSGSTPATAGSGSDGDQSNIQQETTAPPPPPKPEKKPRKKWTPEETQMLVDGCNKHGVGNWKTILRDPTLKFDNRSPVDLKDRFRTYFPDAYKQHYPNAKTHLSSKVRSTLPDGSSIFEKTRSKRRRPFTEEEDRALKEGYEKYGTVWATIVKDYPIFQEQNRRSTDLRDRFRNAFPELYQLAGYKPRNTKKKGTATTTTTTAAAGGSGAGTSTPERGVQTKKAAMDDQQLSTGGPVRSRRRAHTHQGLLRGGTKSVPQSTACSEDDDSDIESDRLFSSFKAPPTPPSLAAKKPLPTTSFSSLGPPVSSDRPVAGDEDEEMNLMTLEPLTEALSLPEIGGSSTQQTVDMDQDGQWSSGINTPTHSNHWSTAAGSPTSSHLSSDLLMNGNDPTSPFLHRHTNPNNNFGMIGKSAWGTDWFSPNPRLDPSSSNLQNANGSGSGSGNGGGEEEGTLTTPHLRHPFPSTTCTTVYSTGTIYGLRPSPPTFQARSGWARRILPFRTMMICCSRAIEGSRTIRRMRVI
ncbi:meiotically up-regulated 152 protein [Coprinopsis cinerea AmutBmut pab1-1]|nr:meiotically up-regulated 152 protein [Coprinopsis cinerea AmutBmut pab1-1]